MIKDYHIITKKQGNAPPFYIVIFLLYNSYASSWLN